MDTKKHFYERFSTWAVLSFLTGASVMVATVVLLGNSALPVPSSTATQASSDLSASGTVTVLVTQPTDGQTFVTGQDIPITAEAVSSSGIQSVALLVDGQLVKSCQSSICTTSIPAASLPQQDVHMVQALANGVDGTGSSPISHFTIISAQ